MKNKEEKSVDELKKEITRLKKELKSKKKYGLVWEEKTEDVVEMCKEKLPILKEVKDKEILTDENLPMNILIEGDNYHALSALNYTHAGKIDLIYIDPPYNTGAKDWKYNNDFVDNNDAYRHSKWICMMERRIKLSKKLLKNSGIIICAIDEYEIHNVRHILDSIFHENNKLGMVTVLHNPKGRNLSKFFSSNSEYMLVYAKDINKANFNEIAIDEEVLASFDQSDNDGNYRFEKFMRVRTSWSRKNKPNNFYPIYVSDNLKILTLDNKQGYHKVLPKTEDGREWAWKNIPDSFKSLNVNEYFNAVLENGRIEIYHKYREQQVFKNVWTNKKYHSEFNGSKILKEILGENIFNYPKSVYLILDILKITTSKTAIILDYFAGSGTTGHAVLQLNKEDKGKRKFILITNNENNICTEVCYPRVEKVINGYRKLNNEKIEGLSGNLKYYKSDFVEAKPTDKNKKKLTEESTEMLCIKEDTFEEVKTKNKSFRVFKNGKKYTGIIYDVMAIDDFKDFCIKIDGKFSVYVFSLSDDTYDEEFEDMKNKVKLSPIPEAILRVYRRIFK